MKYATNVGLIALCGVIFTGCAGVQMPFPVTEKPAASEYAGYLSPRALTAGECGLFVWGLAEERPLLMFLPRGASSADYAGKTGEEKLTLTLTENGEPPFIWKFEDDDGAQLSLEFEGRTNITAGQRYDRGRLVSQTAEGWEKTVPVIGLYGCQSA